MTMTGNEPPADAQRRLAEFELAELGGDPVARNAAIAAIQKSPRRSQGSSRRRRVI